MSQRLSGKRVAVMPVKIVEQQTDGPLSERLTRDSGHDIVLHWLGQAGFIVQAGRRRILIDPYLSDSLAGKYRGTQMPHDRLMAPPIDIDDLGCVDLVLVTHSHTDHMDPDTLAPLARRQPLLRFVAPRAARVEAMRRADIAEDRLIPIEAGERIEAWPGLTVAAVRAAHESLERDVDGFHRFLGYALAFAGEGRQPLTVLHSGDTIPFAGQVEEIAVLRPDLLLLPVNGRSSTLAAQGVAGNLTLEEAVQLTALTGTPAMIGHHHGMFAFNTLPLARIEAKAATRDLPIRLLPARDDVDVRLRWIEGPCSTSDYGRT